MPAWFQFILVAGVVLSTAMNLREWHRASAIRARVMRRMREVDAFVARAEKIAADPPLDTASTPRLLEAVLLRFRHVAIVVYTHSRDGQTGKADVASRGVVDVPAFLRSAADLLEASPDRPKSNDPKGFFGKDFL